MFLQKRKNGHWWLGQWVNGKREYRENIGNDEALKVYQRNVSIGVAADWAKRKNMGEEAIRYANSYALEAERKMGQLLKETERAVGTDKGGKQYSDGNKVLPSDAPLTLADLGLTKRESAEAQMLATLPEAKVQAPSGQFITKDVTGETLAAQYGVSDRTIKRDGAFAQAVETISDYIPDTTPLGVGSVAICFLEKGKMGIGGWAPQERA